MSNKVNKLEDESFMKDPKEVQKTLRRNINSFPSNLKAEIQRNLYDKHERKEKRIESEHIPGQMMIVEEKDKDYDDQRKFIREMK